MRSWIRTRRTMRGIPLNKIMYRISRDDHAVVYHGPTRPFRPNIRSRDGNSDQDGIEIACTHRVILSSTATKRGRKSGETWCANLSTLAREWEGERLDLLISKLN